MFEPGGDLSGWRRRGARRGRPGGGARACCAPAGRLRQEGGPHAAAAGHPQRHQGPRRRRSAATSWSSLPLPADAPPPAPSCPASPPSRCGRWPGRCADPASLPVVERASSPPRRASSSPSRGAELQSAIEGGQVVVRLPRAVGRRPPPRPARQGTTVAQVYGVRTIAEGGEASGWSNLGRLVPRAAGAAGRHRRRPAARAASSCRLGGRAEGTAGFLVYRRPAASRT